MDGGECCERIGWRGTLKRQNGRLLPSPGISEQVEVENTDKYKQKYYTENCLQLMFRQLSVIADMLAATQAYK
jgi:hypothetical protein